MLRPEVVLVARIVRARLGRRRCPAPATCAMHLIPAPAADVPADARLAYFNSAYPIGLFDQRPAARCATPAARAEHPLSGALKSDSFARKMFGTNRLRIAVDHREPGALHLHHDPVSLLEDVIVGRECDLIVHRPSSARSARASRSSCDTARGTHRRQSSVDSRPSSDRSRTSPDTRRSASRSSRCRCPSSRQRDCATILPETTTSSVSGSVTQVSTSGRSIARSADPRPATSTIRDRKLDRTRTIRNRIRRIGNVAVERRSARRRRRVERQLSARPGSTAAARRRCVSAATRRAAPTRSRRSGTSALRAVRGFPLPFR